MQDTTRQPQRNNEEIDLLVVLERAAWFLGRYKFVLLATAVIGAIAGYFYYGSKPKYYESSLILRSQVLTTAEEVSVVSSWNDLIKNGETPALKTILHCDDSLVAEIGGFSAAAVQITSLISGFTVNTSVKNPGSLPALQKAVLYGLQNGPFVKEKVELRKANGLELIRTLNGEIAKLDSFDSRNGYGSGLKGGGVLVMSLSDTNSRKVVLQQKLNDARENLKFVDGVQVLQDFAITQSPAGASQPEMTLFGAVGGVFAGFLFALLRDLRGQILLIRKNRKPAPTEKWSA